MISKQVTFASRRGGMLSGSLDIDGENTRAYGIFGHCFTCGKDLKPFANLSRALAVRGIGLLRFDFAGLGESDGDFSRSTLATNVEDIADAAGYLSESFEAPRIVIGHSLGGIAVLKGAPEIGSVAAVVTIGTPAEPGRLGEKLSRAKQEAERAGEGVVTIGGRTFSLRREFFDQLEAARIDSTLERLERALLVLHSPADEVVGIENASVIFGEARHPKSFVALAGADHLLLKPRDAAYAGEVIAAWAGHYI